MEQVAGKVVLVTGGGGGIGAGIAEAFVEAGAKVCVTDIQADYAADIAKQLGCIGLEHDVADPASWASVKAAVEAQLGPVDVLCNNAGISIPFKPLEQCSLADFDRVMAINVRGVFLGCQAFMAAMKARGAGHIVNTSSVNGMLPHGTFAAYSASKFAVMGLSESIAQELATHGVGVSILYPGLTRSRMSEGQMADLPADIQAAISGKMMEAVWLGRAVVKAVQTNQLHIITHPDHLDAVKARHDVLYAAHGEPAQPGFVGSRING